MRNIVITAPFRNTGHFRDFHEILSILAETKAEYLLIFSKI